MKSTLYLCAFLTLTLPASSLSSGYCDENNIGKKFLILSPNNVYIHKIIPKREMVSLAAEAEFIIESIESEASKYVVRLNDVYGHYQCSEMSIDNQYLYIILKSDYEKVKISVGSQIFVISDLVDLYKHPNNTEVYKPENWRDIYLESLVTGKRSNFTNYELYYKVKFNSGENAYISLFDYNWAISNGQIVYKSEDIKTAKTRFEEEKHIENEKIKKENELKRSKESAKTNKKSNQKPQQDNKIYIGMSKDDVLKKWGKPDDINRTVGRWGVHEQWVYGRTYLYFENEVMTSFQD